MRVIGVLLAAFCVMAVPAVSWAGGAEGAAACAVPESDGTGRPDEMYGNFYPESIEAIQMVERWQLAGDVAMVNGQPEIAYPFYYKIARTLPGTSHGHVAKHRAKAARRQIHRPDNYPPDECWVRELVSLLTW